MDMIIRKFSSFEDVKDDEYRYWQSVPPAECIEAAYQLSVEQYLFQQSPTVVSRVYNLFNTR